MANQGLSPKKESADKGIFGFDIPEYYSIVRSEIEHEDDLINHRLTWLTYTQAILFAAFFAIGAAGPGASEVLRRAYEILPIVGFLSVCFILIGIFLAIYAIRSLRNNFEKIKRSSGEQRVFPELVVKKWSHWLGFIPSIGICIIFLWAWISMSHAIKLASTPVLAQSPISVSAPCSISSTTIEKQHADSPKAPTPKSR